MATTNYKIANQDDVGANATTIGNIANTVPYKNTVATLNEGETIPCSELTPYDLFLVTVKFGNSTRTAFFEKGDIETVGDEIELVMKRSPEKIATFKRVEVGDPVVLHFQFTLTGETATCKIVGIKMEQESE